MAKFCSQCGNPLADNMSFCTKCGAQQAPAAPQAPVAPQAPAAPQAPVYRAPAAPSPIVKLLTGKVSEGKTAFLLLGEQLLALFFFFLPMLSLSYLKQSQWISMFYYLEYGDNTAIIHIVLLFALMAALGLFLMPMLKANGLQLKKQPIADKALPLILAAVSVALFITNIVAMIMFGDDFGDMAGLTVWGILYIIFTVLANAHLVFCWWKSSK